MMPQVKYRGIKYDDNSYKVALIVWHNDTCGGKQRTSSNGIHEWFTYNDFAFFM